MITASKVIPDGLSLSINVGIIEQAIMLHAVKRYLLQVAHKLVILRAFSLKSDQYFILFSKLATTCVLLS